MGNIRHEDGIKPHGKGIQITFYWNGERYRPTLRIEPTKNNLKHAKQLKGEIERAIALNTYTQEKYAEHFPTSRVARVIVKEKKEVEAKREKIKFKKLADDWLLTQNELGCGTLIQYGRYIKHWKALIGERDIDSFTPSEIKIISTSQGWSAKTRNDKLIVLRGIFEMAEDDGLIENDPTAKLKNSKKQKKEACDPLTAVEVESVLNHIGKRYDSRIANYFEFAFFTGMRPSELIALRWDDIDWNHNLVRVQRARTFNQEHGTKTVGSMRDIEMNLRARNALERQKQYTLKKDHYVFENPDTDKPFTETRQLTHKYWHQTLTATELRRRTCYQTRHTYATMNLMAGANPMWVSKQLGHTNMGMLLKVYSKWIDGADKSMECNKLDMMLSATSIVKNMQNATSTPQEMKETT